MLLLSSHQVTSRLHALLPSLLDAVHTSLPAASLAPAASERADILPCKCTHSVPNCCRPDCTQAHMVTMRLT